MMKKANKSSKTSATVALISTALMILMATTLVYADTIFTANLTGSTETPPNLSPATGFGTFVLNDAQTALTLDIDYSGLIGGPLSGAHFHIGPPGIAGPIVRGVDISTATSPSGSLLDLWTASDVQPLTPTLVAALFAGDIYFNIHTTDGIPPDFPGGEIRDQLRPVPEPASSLLFGLGFVGLWVLARMQRRTQ
jgi:hypothetical protein